MAGIHLLQSQSSVITDTPLHGDFGDSRGLEIEVRTLFSKNLNIDMNYSFSKVMQGRATPHKVIFDSTGSPSFEWYDEYGGSAYKSLMIERQFSRPHILKLAINYNTMGLNVPLMSNTNFSLMYRYVSGQSYTYRSLEDTPTNL